MQASGASARCVQGPGARCHAAAGAPPAAAGRRRAARPHTWLALGEGGGRGSSGGGSGVEPGTPATVAAPPAPPVPLLAKGARPLAPAAQPPGRAAASAAGLGEPGAAAAAATAAAGGGGQQQADTACAGAGGAGESADGLLPWYGVVALAASAALICSADRAVISVAILPMSLEYGWSDSVKGAISSAFYAGADTLPPGASMLWPGPQLCASHTHRPGVRRAVHAVRAACPRLAQTAAQLAHCRLGTHTPRTPAAGVGYTLTNLVGGYLAATVGSKRTLGSGVVVWSAFTIATPAAAASGSLPLLMATRCIMGCGEGTAFPSIQQVRRAACLAGRGAWGSPLVPAICGPAAGRRLTPFLRLLRAR